MAVTKEKQQSDLGSEKVKNTAENGLVHLEKPFGQEVNVTGF